MIGFKPQVSVLKNGRLIFHKPTKGNHSPYKPYNPNHLDIDFIIETVCIYFRTSRLQVLSKSRRRQAVYPRQIIQYFAREYTGMSFADIGHQVGGKDHATALYSGNVINNLIDTEKKVLGDIDKIRKLLGK